MPVVMQATYILSRSATWGMKVTVGGDRSGFGAAKNECIFWLGFCCRCVRSRSFHTRCGKQYESVTARAHTKDRH